MPPSPCGFSSGSVSPVLCLMRTLSLGLRPPLVTQTVKSLPAMQETGVQSLSRGSSLEEGMATHSSVLAWSIPMNRGAWRVTVHVVAKSQFGSESYSVGFVSGVQHSESVTYLCFFYILFPYTVIRDVEENSLCCPVGASCLSVFHVVVCVCSSQTPHLTLPQPFPLQLP